jgi:hypothetical protein
LGPRCPGQLSALRATSPGSTPGPPVARAPLRCSGLQGTAWSGYVDLIEHDNIIHPIHKSRFKGSLSRGDRPPPRLRSQAQRGAQDENSGLSWLMAMFRTTIWPICATPGPPVARGPPHMQRAVHVGLAAVLHRVAQVAQRLLQRVELYVVAARLPGWSFFGRVLLEKVLRNELAVLNVGMFYSSGRIYDQWSWQVLPSSSMLALPPPAWLELSVVAKLHAF